MSCKRILVSSLLIVGALIFCSGCQNNPNKNIIVSKQDNILSDSPVAIEGEENTTNATTISYNSSFSSTDGSVNFTMNITQNISTSDLPVIQVGPHYLTSADAKTVAFSLFPDAVFYEAESQLSENFSKSEIQEKLSRWTQYANMDSIEELFGEGESYTTLDIIKSYIEAYTGMYEQAPEENPHLPCAWTMRKASEYTLLENELSGADLSNDNDEVCTQCTVNGIPYRLSVTTRNQSDFKVNIITCCIDDGLSPRNIDERIFSAKLCRTEEPVDAQLVSLQEKAEQLLSRFNLGQWEVDECYVETRYIGNYTEYMVHVNAVPVLNDVPVLRHPQLTALRNQDGYAPNQYLTDAQFVFSPSGDLISFTLYTPLESQNVVSENANVMTFNNLLARAEEYLSLTDSYNYGFGEYLFFIQEDVQCNVSVSDFIYGLSRIKVPDTDDSYYYVPSIILKGTAECIGKETGKTYYLSDEVETFMVINAVDGSLINSTNT